ncbi:hypothetical protein WMZ97_10750 [Lentibacillus sp. N15]|uniref:hypothetical protein n=1 Tax=Lentibacillus songyuanensis TaxID=3136161 RepID=UPI0031BB0FB1
MKEYKSPVAALLWAITMSGFGQYYNGQYIFGTVLFIAEVLINGLSGINASIILSFQADIKSHNVFNDQWGLFYPSAYIFGIWQAYNKAIVINYHQDGEDPPRETYLTGFFFGYVIGMNLGVYWLPLSKIPYLKFISSPIVDGLIIGLIIALTGHLIERYNKKRAVRKVS